ncbi:RNA polymerase sigma-70 factor (ECF subfamily) [Dyadobacter jejuensis]|uniref:RNA polymerase sigma-70 factor (ECF subfamily) n=1 Tax=Dyadobacter jejuensis TaxID=1082580 RepID=A0A316AGC4_9BACT|nr:RNA polymerase sigma-70 factor [Dyadobacter jejuensis]PWJ56835.1 RNA polymerase sigma-70 factor (ECF subfamily) [Dyadobacter jejuensis]
MNQLYITYSDEEILHLIIGQDSQEAFEELYDRYFKVLYNFAYSKIDDEYISQEIIQELFVTFWQQRHENVIKSCRPYLFGMLRNLILLHYRKEYTRQRHYNEWVLTHDDVSDLLPDQPALTNELQIRYEKGLEILPPKCRQVFLLSRQGRTYRQIASELSISEKTVEQHISKAIQMLKRYLKEHLPYLMAWFTLWN